MSANTSLGRALDLAISPLAHERVTSECTHRPWPLPSGSWVMAQSWVDLLFAHWRVPPGVLRRAVPRQLELDRFEGEAWIGVTPFEVRNLRLRPTPPVPYLSSFAEINVRTYVTYDGRPGIYFFSLDAASRLAVAAARRFYRLPYFRAEMEIRRARSSIACQSVRADRGGPEATFRATYRSLEAIDPPPDSLERWLTERYCLYTLDERQRVLIGHIHHPPWLLRAAEAEIALNTMGAEVGEALDEAPLVHYSARQDVVFWPLRPADDAPS